MASAVKEKTFLPKELEGAKTVFCLFRQDQYEHAIMQITLHDGKAVDVKLSKFSSPDVTAARFADMIRRGETVESII